MPQNQTASILDCTIRDGNYVVDFQFTKEDTFVFTKGLSEAGIRRIEVGHGLGLNASKTKGQAAETDEEYIRAACAAANGKSSIGSFFIPGIGREDDIRAAHDAGLGFIRLGVDVDEYAKLEPYVKLSKSLGLEVWVNLMKSYVVKPNEFGQITKRIGELGMDVIAIVDSAGGMMPDDVAAYTLAARAKTDIPLGFHGHNNLTLAVANCLRFVNEGGRYVDGSLAGLGRSGGNAATELLAVILSRQNQLADSVDWERLIEFADSVMQFCLPGHSRPRAAEVATGLNYFHSSYSDVVDKAISATGASLFSTLLRLPEISRKKVEPEVALLAAQEAIKSQTSYPVITGRASDRLERVQPKNLTELADRMRVDRGKFPQPRVVSVAIYSGKEKLRVGPLRKNAGSIVAHIEVLDTATFQEVKAALSDITELWLVDKNLAALLPREDPGAFYVYDDERLIAQALADAVQMLGIKSATIIGGELEGINLMLNQVILRSNGENTDAIVTCSAEAPAGADAVAQLRDGGIMFLLRAGALSEKGFIAARERGIPIWRLDCGAALVAEAERILNTRLRFQAGAGTRVLSNGKCIVAGGFVGKAGDIIVDDCQHPRFILGEADGHGGINSIPENPEESIQQWIIESWKL